VKNRLRTIAAILSACVCALAIAGWVRSKFVGDVVVWNGVENCGSLFVMDGVVRMLYAETGGFPPGWMYESFDWRGQTRAANVRSWEELRGTWHGWLGFKYERSQTSADGRRAAGYAQPGATVRMLHVPFWAIVLVTAILPLLALRRSQRRRQRRLTGLCVECGYDMRATPERCPECGWSAEPRPAVTYSP
jgi:hypothetical protein